MNLAKLKNDRLSIYVKFLYHLFDKKHFSNGELISTAYILNDEVYVNSALYNFLRCNTTKQQIDDAILLYFNVKKITYNITSLTDTYFFIQAYNEYINYKK